MKTLQESIIGRKGAYSSSKLWLLYPVSQDYTTALNVLPNECRIYFDNITLFCMNRQQLKEFFDSLSHNDTFISPESVLFEIVPRYLRNFNDVKNWIVRLSSTEDFDSIFRAKETNQIIVNIPKYIKSL